MKPSFFSVVICAYNEEKWIESCLESVINQSFEIENYDILVIDDESTDKTSQIVDNFIKRHQGRLPKIEYIKIPHGGVAVARNMGVYSARGDIIAFIDADAIADKDWLKEISRTFDTNNVEMVGGKIDLLNQDVKFARLIHIIRYFQVFDPSNYRNHFIACNLAIHRDVFDGVPGFYESFLSRGEETTFYQMAKRKFRFAPAENAIVYHERPEQLWDWLRLEWKEKLMGVISDRIIDKDAREIVIMSLEYIEKLLILFFPLTVIFMFVSFNVFPLLMLSFAALLRSMFIKKSHRLTFIALKKEYGLVKSFFLWWLYIEIDAILSLIGRLVGMYKFRSEQVVEPYTTAPVVLVQKTNF